MMTSLCHFSHISIFSDISLEISQQLHGGYTLKLLLTNCSFHTENTWTFVFCIDLISFGPYVKTAVRKFCCMDLTIGP